MLLQEEQHIIRWLTQYGALAKAQVIRMLRDKTPKIAEKIVRNLKREQMIFDIAGGYYLGVDSVCQPDQRIILAFYSNLQTRWSPWPIIRPLILLNCFSSKRVWVMRSLCFMMGSSI